MTIWRSFLIKFVHNACEFCHQNQFDCYESIDSVEYIYYINKSFYSFDERKRPIGMGIFYYFDLKMLHSKTNTKYFLTKGTLNGVLRHHDIIPWATDIDLFIPSSAINKILKAFRQLDLSSDKVNKTTKPGKAYRSYQQDLVVYHFKNIYEVQSYKIFSLRSPIVNHTNYRWPKIDLFPYQENSSHIYAYPQHQHNLGTMNYTLKTDIEPLYLRSLGPLLVPSRYHPRRSLTVLVKLGRSNIFFVCVGNTFSHRSHEKTSETWRLPCRELHKTYPFVKYERNSTNRLCYEQLIFSQQNQNLSLYKYKCNEDLKRTL